MPPRISVVVPIYNVERYLSECLESVVGQTFGDLEVVMVDDGSTDASAAIARDFAQRDGRFRLVTQANGGLGKARNTGIDAATGTFLAFLDSDDVLPPNAYELLHGALEETGSDFATGNIHRLSRNGTRQSPFAAKAFRRTRLRTHVTRFRPLVADRTAWNKLWRRDFWDRHELRFPEGVVHEDIPVVLPAHFMAQAVDVVADPVYYYRIREGGELSITQRRLEQSVLRDRAAAVQHVSDFLAREGHTEAKRWYDESVISDDLRYHLQVLERADDGYRELFLDLANAFLDGADKGVTDSLPAISRLKWELVRLRRMPELLEVLRFEREDLRETAPVRIRGRWYGDYPFRTDPELRIPLSVYRLGQELGLTADVEALRLEGGRLHVSGYAYVDPVGAPQPRAQHVSLALVRPGRLRPVLARVTPFRAPGVPHRRPDVAADVRRPVTDATWSGFEATLDLRHLHPRGRWRTGNWELHVAARAGAVTRRRLRFPLIGPAPLQAVEARLPDGTIVRAGPARNGHVAVQVREAWARAGGAGVDGDDLVVRIETRTPGAQVALEVGRRGEQPVHSIPLVLAGDGPVRTAEARVPVAAVAAATTPADDEGGRVRPLDLFVVDGAKRLRVGLATPGDAGAWPWRDLEVSLDRASSGDASLIARAVRATATAASWTEDHALELAGVAPPGRAPTEIVLRARDSLAEHAFGVVERHDDGGFAARLEVARIVSLAGALPLQDGTWDVLARGLGADGGARPEATPLRLAAGVAAVLPATTVAEHKPFTLGRTVYGDAKLLVRRDLDEDEQGRFHALRLQRAAYAARRGDPLRDAVVYSSFHGRQYSDSPRAIHEELIRRDAPFEHLWMVRDGRCRVPETARPLREGSREYYEALARARYVVFNDHFPEWFVRRDDQACVQTWHGTPLKKLGFDASEMQGTMRKFERGWERQSRNWQYVVSPNRFTTPLLRRAYALEHSEMLETGYPRDDVLAGPALQDRGREVRARLGLPAGARVVLYAPTYRDQVRDRHGFYRLDLRLDVERLRDALGPDAILLIRKHHYLVDAVPVTADGFVRDVSSYPDGTELMAAADVLVTDYSSMMFDFANTGRPMVFFTYDLEAYRDEIRGFYFDFVDAAPGPLVRTSDELAEVLRDLDGIPAGYEQRYAHFAARFCELDDGRAAARVVDRIFDW